MARTGLRTGTLLAAPLLLAVGACSEKPGPMAPEETEVPGNLAAAEAPATVPDSGLGTPREQRVATLGLLNKRNNLTQDIEIKPGETRRVCDVIVRLATCERTAPWETPPETGAFVQVYVAQRKSPGAEPQWRGIFSGWLFKNSPSLNVVEHPIYDVWVKDCAMSFPGEEKAVAASSSSAPKPSGTASPAPSPTASATPSASPSPTPSASPAAGAGT